MENKDKFWKKYQEADSSKRQEIMGELFEPKQKYMLGNLVGGFISLMVGAVVLSVGVSMLAQVRSPNPKKISYHIPLNPG